MPNIQTLSTVLGIALGISGALFVMFPVLKSKGVQVDKVLEKADTILDGADGVINAAKVIAPQNETVNILDEIEKIAHKAVRSAQQLFISSQLPADKRKEKAKEYALAALKVLKIEVTPELETSIDGSIEDVIFASKTPEEIKTQENGAIQNQVSQLQQQITDLQSQNTQLQQDNVQLKNTINTVQSTVQVTSK